MQELLLCALIPRLMELQIEKEHGHSYVISSMQEGSLRSPLGQMGIAGNTAIDHVVYGSSNVGVYVLYLDCKPMLRGQHHINSWLASPVELIRKLFGLTSRCIVQLA